MNFDSIGWPEEIVLSGAHRDERSVLPSGKNVTQNYICLSITSRRSRDKRGTSRAENYTSTLARENFSPHVIASAEVVYIFWVYF